MAQKAQGTRHWSVSQLYSLHGDSSEEEDLASGKGLRGGYDDCCVCCVCGETFTFLNNLVEHFNVHKGEVRCHLCRVTFTRAISLALHLENAHSNYNLYCTSCEIKFWTPWHMNQHMRKHFEDDKVEPPNEDAKPPQSEAQKSVLQEVEEVMVKTEEVEIRCVKDEEEEVPLGIISRFTKVGQHSDHNYCCNESPRAPSSCSSGKEQQENDTNMDNEPVQVFNNKPNTEDSDSDTNDGQEKKLKVVVLPSSPQREDVSNTDAACEGRILGEKPHKTEPNQEITRMSSPSPSEPPELDLAQLELNVKLEDDSENETLECAPIEEDAENPDENSDSSVRSSLYSPVKDLSSDTDSAFEMSSDCDSNSAEEGSIRLLRSRAVKKRRVRVNTNEKPVHPENSGASTDVRTADCSPLNLIKISTSNENNLFSNYTCLSCRHVFPNQKTFLMHSCGTFKVTGGRSVSSIKRLTKEDYSGDHTYSTMNSGERPVDSNQTLAQHTKRFTEPVNMSNDESDTEDSDTEESEREQENVEIVVLRPMPQIGGVTNTGRVVLQAAYEKVIKTQVREERARKKTKKLTKEATHKSSLPDSVSVKLEPEQLELSIKQEDNAEANTEASLWECAPIEEDIEDIKEEEKLKIKEESDNTEDISLFAPLEDPSSETDEGSEFSTDGNGNNSDHSEEVSTRQFQSSTVQKIPIYTNANEKPTSSLNASSQLATSKSTPVPSSVKVSVGPPQLSTSKKIPQSSSVKRNTAPNPNSSKSVSQICTSCGLYKVPSKTKPTEQCRCMPKTCYMCGEVLESDQLLLKHQAEKHPLIRYICSTCGQMFPNQNSFVSHACCQHNVPRRPNVTPVNPVNDVKNPPSVFLKFVPSPAVQASSNQPQINNGASQTVASPYNLIVSNNGINIVDAYQKLGGMSNPSLSLLPNHPGSNQSVPVQMIAPVTPNNGSHNVASLALNGGQTSVPMPVPTATWANTGQMQVLIPPSSPANLTPNQTEIVFQGGVPSQTQQVLDSLSDSSAPGSSQSRVTLRIPASLHPSNSNKVSVSFSPKPAQLPTPSVVSVGSKKRKPSTSQSLPAHARPFVVPLPKPALASASPPICSASSIFYPQDSCPQTFCPDQTLFLSQGSLKVVTMFVNQSQELALQKRKAQTWHSKNVFSCRHCGINARQPSLGIRHRYQHRGPRLHKCQCGRTFQQRLHLLRHQVQHAESVRYVCAACGQTFHGTQQLAFHQQKVLLRSLKSNTKKLVKRDCRNLFRCACGQGFVRSSALLWHMLKNVKLSKRSKKGSRASDLAT